MIEFLFKPVYGEIALILGYAYILCLLMSVGILAIRSAQVEDFCGKKGIDEVDFLLERKDPLAKSWWRALLSYFGVICLSGWL